LAERASVYSLPSSMSRGLALLGLFVVVSLATRAPFLSVPILDLDEAAHAVGSWELQRGGRLYTDFADNKPPLVYAVYAAAQALLGPGLPAVRTFTALLVLPLTAWAASYFHGHGRRGAAAGLLYLVYGAAFLAHDMHAVHAEVLFLLPAAWAVALLRDERDAACAGRLAAAGLLLGAATLLKHHAALWLLAPLAMVARAERRPGLVASRWAVLAAGFTAPLLGAWLAFAATGGAGDFVYWTLTSNFAYAANPMLASEALLRAARGPLPFLIVTAPLAWMAWRSRVLLGAHQRLLLAVLAATAAAGAAVGLRFYPHYLIPLYLPLALGAAPAVAERPLPRAFAAWTLAMLAGFTAANHVLYRARPGVYEETSPLYARVRDALRRDPAFAGATLFVWGYAPGFYYHLPELRPASRFVMPQASLTGYLAGNTATARGEVDARAWIVPSHWDLLIADLEQRRATFILDTSPSGLHRWNHFPLRRFPRLDAYVRAHYLPIAHVDGVVIYRRQDPRGAPPPSS
jgi:hypothetical protein